MKVGIYMGYKDVYTSACIATYRANGDFLRDLLLRVDVDLVELCALNLAGELLEEWRDHAARAAPRRPEVDEDGLVLLDLYARGQKTHAQQIPEFPRTISSN